MFSISEQEAARQAAKLYTEIRGECCDNETSSLPLNEDNFDHHQFTDLLEQVMSDWDIKGYCSLFTADSLDGVMFNHQVCFDHLACNVITTLLELGLLRYRYRSFDDLPKTNQNVVDTTRLDDSQKKGYEKAVKFILTVIDKSDSYYYDVPEELFALKGKSVLSDCTTSDIQLLEKYMGLNSRNEQITVLLKEEISDD